MSEMKYPIGQFKYEGVQDQKQRSALIANIEILPADLQATVHELKNKRLDTPIRTGAWTIRQVVHHLADSHMNAFIRFKWTLTEEKPRIKAYNQDEWAQTADAKEAAVESSLTLLKSVHDRWAFLMKSMKESDFNREFEHPQSGLWNLNKALALYEWHGRHHLAQIRQLITQSGS